MIPARTITRRVIDIKKLSAQIGAAIRKERKRQGLSQAEVSWILGMTRAGVANLELGHQRVHIEHLYNLSLAWDVPITRFLP